MNIILLSGGSGKRLWPLSNDIRSKQFIKIFKNEEEQYESMLQRMYNGIKRINEDTIITIATSQTQASTIKNQIGDDVNISLEPARRDTFPAIVLATSYLHDVLNIPADEAVVVCPIDPYVEDDYFEVLDKLYRHAKDSDANLTLLGIRPTYPSEKYGYIIPQDEKEISNVKTFKEKPDEETAKEYINEGALWNGGIFAYKLKYILDLAHKLIEFNDYYDLFDKYETLEKISFDYAVVEKEKNIDVIKFDGAWKDLGTWNTLTESIDDKVIGRGTIDDVSSNVNIINELNVPILCMGLKDVVIAASNDGILVSDKHNSSYIKPYVEQITDTIRFAEKSWGTYKVIDVQNDSMTILVTLNSGHQMKYHSHDYRDEIWTVISGTGKTIVDGIIQEIKPGDVITINAGSKHTIIADTDLKVVEVQIGKDINVSDKKVYKLKRF